jgi:hypothetical protein
MPASGLPGVRRGGLLGGGLLGGGQLGGGWGSVCAHDLVQSRQPGHAAGYAGAVTGRGVILRLRTRAQMVLLAAEQGLVAAEIAPIVRKDEETVRRWFARS